MVHRLRQDEAHVHYAKVDPTIATWVLEGERVLSEDEVARASRFVRPVDRAHFVAAHALLRHTLSRYADVPPDAWSFEADQFGKPRLSGPEAGWLGFNLTHARGLVACAVGAPDLAIGIDVEPIERHLPDVMALARRFFSRPECDALASCADDDRALRFIEVWTLKEAFVKAVGSGLSHPLDTFGFDVGEGGALRFHSSSTASGTWQFAMYGPTQTHRLSIALGGAGADQVAVSAWSEGVKAVECRKLATWAGAITASPPS